MSQPQPSGGGSFAVDITRAPEAIRQLEHALEELRRIRQDAALLAQITPPTRDQVSVDAARVLGLKGQGDSSSFSDALEAGITELTRMIDGLRSGFEAYRNGDVQAESAFRAAP